MVPLQPCVMLVVTGVEGLLLFFGRVVRRQRTVNLVLPPGCSSKVKIDSISSGQVGAGMAGQAAGLVGKRIDEDQLLRRHDFAIDLNLPHMTVPFGRLHAVVVGAADAQIHFGRDAP